MGFWFGEKHDDGYNEAKIFSWLRPKVTGNQINGLGETVPRNPTPLLWHRLKYIRFGLIQLLFQSRFRPRIALQHTQMGFDFIRIKKSKKQLKLQQPATEKKYFTDATAEVKHQAHLLGVDNVGVTKLRPEWIFDSYQLPDWAQQAMDQQQLYLIVMAVQHKKESFASAPSWDFSREIAKKYNDGSVAGVALARWILQQGYPAYGHGGPEAGEFLLIPAAIEAGLGELGKHGSMINPKLGSNSRLACVYTTLPLQTDQPKDFGIDDFCTRCQVCVRACPPKALKNEKQMVRGVEKFYVDFDKCMPYMTDNYGCGICLNKCPWSIDRSVDKLFRKQQKKLFGVEFPEHPPAVDSTIYQPIMIDPAKSDQPITIRSSEN